MARRSTLWRSTCGGGDQPARAIAHGHVWRHHGKHLLHQGDPSQQTASVHQTDLSRRPPLYAGQRPQASVQVVEAVHGRQRYQLVGRMTIRYDWIVNSLEKISLILGKVLGTVDRLRSKSNNCFVTFLLNICLW